jgi:hypothetical protein
MQVQRVRTQFGPVQAGIIITTLITAGVHLYLVSELIAEGLSPTLFLLNGLGYLGLLTALFLPQPLVERFLPSGMARAYRPFFRYALMGYALLTIFLWLVMNGMRTPIAFIDKLAEITLVILLWLDRGRA